MVPEVTLNPSNPSSNNMHILHIVLDTVPGVLTEEFTEQSKAFLSW